MRTNSVTNDNVIVSGAKQTGNFSIAANGKAFKILIDGLYSNKIQAIVRELSSNAFDSHAAANRLDMPFELHLPNLLDPTFVVRDYGTSLDHDMIMGLYTTVFQSTKEDSNLSVGKFGLGSKTPFAYTDSFTVTAFLRGTKRVYGAYIDTTGIPMISLMASEDTGELDGLMVSFPVNVKDCERFRVETERVLSGFDIKPTVKGAEVKPTIYESKYEGSNFRILKNSRIGALARQGCVIYPIDLDALPDLTPKQKNILNTNILIDFPIGQVDITPSRESLSYDDATIKNILVMAEKIDDEITASLKEEVNKARVLYDVQVLVSKFIDMDLKSADAFAKSLTWNGKLVKTYYSIDREKLKKTHGVLITEMHRSYFSEKKSLRFNYTSYRADWNVTGNTVFIFESEQVLKAATRVKAFSEANPHVDNIVWIKQYDKDQEVNIRSLRKLLGYAPIIHMADLELPVNVKTTRATPLAREFIRVKTLNVSDDRQEEVLLIEAAPYQYVVEDGKNYFKTLNSYVGKRSYKDFIEFLKLNRDDIKIIQSKQLKRVEKFSNWEPLFSKDNVQKLKNACPFKEHYDHEHVSVYNDHWITNYSGYLDKSYDKETSWKKLLDILEKLVHKKKAPANTQYLWLLRDIIGHNDFNEITKNFEHNEEESESVKEYFEEVCKEYPFLKTAQKQYLMSETEFASLIQDYIKLVDESKN